MAENIYELEIRNISNPFIKPKKKLFIQRYFSNEDLHPYEEVKWVKSNIDIASEDGKTILFTQKDFEHPDFYSHLANKVIASRYAYGEQDTPERENSLKTIINRVAKTYGKWALKLPYFNESDSNIFVDEIIWLTLNQYMSFNSPVWFNVGTDKYPSKIRSDKRGGFTVINDEVVEISTGQTHLYPQTSACFIQSVGDDMEDIMDLARREAMLFKDGSGTGTDLSTLRSSKEKLSGGGKPSGPLAYEIFYNDVAEIVKSGGKTRRAAKMNSLKIWHPDIKEFIVAKLIEQNKIRALVNSGYPPEEAIISVHYQSANFSVRLTDDFMNAVENDGEWKTKAVHNHELNEAKKPDGNWIIPRYKAKELFNLIAKGTWDCGDPGVQFEDIINKWHTCPNSGRINASNPCSEYMFLDDSACNLASINLMKFRKDDGNFNIERFLKTIEIMTIAMDLNVDNSSYPTKKITENAHKFRPVGMGFSNLGSLVMSLGLPYDSDEARATAAVITALMTGKVYETSTVIAEKIGTFKEYEKNKEPMLKVMDMHRDALKKIDINKLPTEIKLLYDEAKKIWDNVILRGREYGFRNAQASLLAPTGTISFMMDCDTTGIEPDTALVKYKRLAEGGLLKIVNRIVPLALKRLGYNPEQIKIIEDYINKEETIEGAPNLKEEHLAIFDCAFKPEKGKRFISYKGHIKMMTAVQMFLSGAISKTINMPEEATSQQIEETYMEGWKLGLKAVAIYRDKSKTLQPLTTSKRISNGKVFQTESIERNKLPNERKSITKKFNVAGHEGYITVGLYDDGSPGEVFINMSKEGSTIGGLMDNIGVLTSFLLQYGVPLDVISKKMKNNRFEPYGIVLEGGEEQGIRTAKSITDFIFNWLGHKFVPGFDENGSSLSAYDDENKEKTPEKKEIYLLKNNTPKVNSINKLKGELGKFCPECGEQMIKLGHCEERCTCGFIDFAGCGG